MMIAIIVSGVIVLVGSIMTTVNKLNRVPEKDTIKSMASLSSKFVVICFLVFICLSILSFIFSKSLYDEAVRDYWSRKCDPYTAYRIGPKPNLDDYRFNFEDGVTFLGIVFASGFVLFIGLSLGFGIAHISITIVSIAIKLIYWFKVKFKQHIGGKPQEKVGERSNLQNRF